MTPGSTYIADSFNTSSIAAVDRLDKHFRRLTKPVFQRYGFAYADVLSQWSAIVGDELGRVSVPERIRWPRATGSSGDGVKRGGTMVLRVAEGRALEFQHLAPRIIERVNGFYGYEAVTVLKILQGPVVPPASPKRQPAPEIKPEVLGAQAEAIHDEALRAALLRLGSAVSHRGAASSRPTSATRMQS
jgi:hypothetical protein